MTHTSTEQPWWRKHTDEIERKVASGEMNAATCFTKMLWLVSEASKAQRVMRPRDCQRPECMSRGCFGHCMNGITQEPQQ